MAVKYSSSLPAPEGPFQVGYHDIMTHGEPDSSVYFRLYYPAPAHTKVKFSHDHTIICDHTGFPNWKVQSPFYINLHNLDILYD